MSESDIYIRDRRQNLTSKPGPHAERFTKYFFSQISFHLTLQYVLTQISQSPNNFHSFEVCETKIQTSENSHLLLQSLNPFNAGAVVIRQNLTTVDNERIKIFLMAVDQ